MGFSEADSIYALEITSNNIEMSVNFLMNNPNPTGGTEVRMAPPSQMTNNRPNTALSSSSEQSQNSDVNRVGYASRLAAQTQQRTQALV